MKYTMEQMKNVKVGVIGTKRDKDGILTRFATALYLDGVTGANTAAEQYGTRQTDFTTRHYAVVDAVNVAKAHGLPITHDVRRDYAESLRYVREDEYDRAKAAEKRAAEKTVEAKAALDNAQACAEMILKTIKA